MANNILTDLIRKYPKVFWVVMFFELMERAAYYSMTPIIVIHAQYNLGISEGWALSIFFFMWPIQYGLPILSGAISEKIGYKKQMIFAFIFLTIAYVFLFFAFNLPTLILALMAVGIGIGSYKPLIQATIAKSTSTQDRDKAFSIYYWIVNLGAFVVPLIYVGLELAGVFNTSMYAYVFLIGGILVSVNILVAIFSFKEVAGAKAKSYREVFNNVRIAFQDRKFVIMVLLIGGFWALYSTMLNLLPTVAINFHFVPIWASAMFLGVFNPLTIILFGGFISKYCERLESLKAVMAGVLLYAIGIAIIGFFFNIVGIIIGTIVSSVGEFMLAPGYISFVSKLATKEKVAAYLGCNFLSSAIGLAGGNLIFGQLGNIIAIQWQRPIFFYGILTALSLLLLVCFMVYYHAWGKNIIERAKRIREMEETKEEALLEVPAIKKEPSYFKVLDFKVTAIVPLVLIPIVLIASWAMGTNVYYPPGEETPEIEFSLENYDAVAGEGMTEASPSPLGENSEATTTFTASPADGQLVKSVTFTLTWTDEEDYQRVPGGRTWENQPDEFSFDLSLPADPEDPTTTAVEYSSSVGTNAHGQPGLIETTITFDHTKKESMNGTGAWQIIVSCGNCGDKTNPYSALMYTDTGNTYELTVAIEYYAPRTAEKK